MSSDPPPSYESVIESIKSQLPTDPNSNHIFEAVAALPDDHFAILVDNAKQATLLSAADAAKVQTAFEEHVAKSQEDLKNDGDASGKAVASINTLFTNMRAKLAVLDAKHTPSEGDGFVEKLDTQHDAFTALIHESSALAVKIATYSDRFSTQIIPLVQMIGISKEKRREMLQTFRADGDAFKSDAQKMSDRLNKLKEEFGDFVSTFATWAEGRIGELQAEIKQLVQELEVLEKHLRNLTIAMATAGATLTISIGVAVTLFFACANPANAPGCIGIVVALISAGVSAIALLALTAAVFVVRAKIASKKDELEDRRSKLEDLVQARLSLLEMGNSALITFNGNIDLLGNVWSKVDADCEKIDYALSNATDDQDIATLFERDLQHAAKFYQSMARYMNSYADGVGITPANPPPSAN